MPNELSNCMIAFPNLGDAAILSGGAWVPTLPLAHMQSRKLGVVARTQSAQLAATQFDVDLGASKNCRVIAVVNHNLSLDARYRLRASVDGGQTWFSDSGWQDVWPSVYPSEQLDWEEDNWWTGKYASTEITGYTPTLSIILPSTVIARLWRVELADTGNPVGYVQVGRLFIGPAWSPRYNMSYGASISWATATEVQSAYSGAETFSRRNPYRVVRFSLDWLDLDEGLAKGFELDRQAGIDREVFYIFDPTDTVHALRRRFLGRLSELSALEFPYPLTTKKPYTIKEIQ